MTGTELRYRLGAFYAEQEAQNGMLPGCSPPAIAWRFRSLSARPATAACS